jgi:hypothetical protein
MRQKSIEFFVGSTTGMPARQLKYSFTATALLFLVEPAFADAIDGNWCHSDGRHFSIRGPEIITPGGKTMEGNYSRHWFSYVVPVPEPGSGQTIFMTLLNENTVDLRLGETSAPAEIWLRCRPSISGRRILPPA